MGEAGATLTDLFFLYVMYIRTRPKDSANLLFVYLLSRLVRDFMNQDLRFLFVSYIRISA